LADQTNGDPYSYAEDPPPRPDVSIPPPADVPPRLWTFLAAGGALIATVMSIPAAATTFTPESGSVDWEGPSGWQKTLWVIAFCLGTLSMVLAVTSLRVERKRGSRTGRTLANGAIVIALIGSAVWAWPSCVRAANGL
jgi:hypothetical protein